MQLNDEKKKRKFSKYMFYFPQASTYNKYNVAVIGRKVKLRDDKEKQLSCLLKITEIKKISDMSNLCINNFETS